MKTIAHKTLRREDWTNILKRSEAYMPLRRGDFAAMTSLFHLQMLKKPLMSDVFGEMTTILDDGYYWLQIAPEKHGWWLSVMFTETGRLQQYYFDVAQNNNICGEDSTFDDLLLDIVVRPDGAVKLLDADEMEEAFIHGAVTQSEYELAWKTAKNLMNALPLRIGELEQFCYNCVEQLTPMLK